MSIARKDSGCVCWCDCRQWDTESSWDLKIQFSSKLWVCSADSVKEKEKRPDEKQKSTKELNYKGILKGKWRNHDKAEKSIWHIISFQQSTLHQLWDIASRNCILWPRKFTYPIPFCKQHWHLKNTGLATRDAYVK